MRAGNRKQSEEIMEAEGSDKVQLTPDRLLTGHKTRVHAHTRV